MILSGHQGCSRTSLIWCGRPVAAPTTTLTYVPPGVGTEVAGDCKIALEMKPHEGHHNSMMGPRPTPVKRSLPFVTGIARGRAHRVRRAMVHWHPWSTSWATKEHISVAVWCGNSPSHPLFLSNAAVTQRCDACEVRAVAAGLPPWEQLP